MIQTASELSPDDPCVRLELRLDHPSGRPTRVAPNGGLLPQAGCWAPAGERIADGVTLALASDANAGRCGPSPSMAFAKTLACLGVGLSLEEAICAATLRAG